MICDCCDWKSRRSRTSPDDVGWCSTCRTYQWRKHARLHVYLDGGKPEKGHGCVRCDAPWGADLGFVWHPRCDCGMDGHRPAHKLVQLVPGDPARVNCSCGWTGTGRIYVRTVHGEGRGDSLWKKLSVERARSVFESHRWLEHRCDCSCHRLPACMKIHADRRDQHAAPDQFACEHSA
jgi:hypothetical protein